MGFFTAIGIIVAVVILIKIARIESIRYLIEKSRLEDEWNKRNGR